MTRIKTGLALMAVGGCSLYFGWAGPLFIFIGWWMLGLL